MKKNPGVVAVLNFFIPGLGYVYVGKFSRALIHFLITVFVTVKMYLPDENTLIYLIIGFFNMAIAVYVGYDDTKQDNIIDMIKNRENIPENEKSFGKILK